MNVRVLLHVALLVKPFAAVRARIRPRITMDEKVRRESAGPLESLSALLAFEHFLHVMHSPVEIVVGSK